MKKQKNNSCFRLSLLEVIGLVFILSVAALVYFQRLWFLRFFTYDQARDALYISRILKGQFRLIGTQSSIPGLYTAPFYYYLMAPFLLLFNHNPVGIDFATGVFSLLASALLYFSLRSNGVKPVLSGLVLILFSFCPQVVLQSRFSWNPNPLPLLAIIFLIGARAVFVKHQPKYWWLIGLSVGLAINFHYSGLGLAFGLGLVFLLFRYPWVKQWRWVVLGLGIIAALVSPLLL
ncbi:glycosyltransferase family 39 protein, partial [Patescibacteria group bacterium]|nr:glycosyltransferase family 39 protein [Patescibacteria group bacterium]